LKLLTRVFGFEYQGIQVAYQGIRFKYQGVEVAYEGIWFEYQGIEVKYLGDNANNDVF
jgi:hypothetical protein